MAKFLAAVRRGERLTTAARAAGFTLEGFYGKRRRDAAFAARWQEAMDEAAVLGFVRPGNRRQLQHRKMKHVRFTGWRIDVFLDHFAGTCDTTAAALAAGVHESTVYKRRRIDPDFARAWDEALRQGYIRLEAEAVRQRLEAQRQLREGTIPTGEIAAEFERVLKLLARWERRDGRIAPRAVSHARRRTWTFDEAIALLEKRLRSLGVPIPPPEPEPGEGP